MSRAIVIIRRPTRIKTGAVAWAGMTLASGAKNIESKKRTPTTMAASPVRAPSATPAALSM